jgi:hypothetical protein
LSAAVHTRCGAVYNIENWFITRVAIVWPEFANKERPLAQWLEQRTHNPIQGNPQTPPETEMPCFLLFKKMAISGRFQNYLRMVTKMVTLGKLENVSECRSRDSRGFPRQPVFCSDERAPK